MVAIHKPVVFGSDMHSLPFLVLLGAVLQGVLITAAPVHAVPAWKRAVPYSKASSDAATAADAVLHEAGSEECLRGKLSNAIVQLSNSCDASDRSTPVCELASDIAGQESELSMGEMLSTSEKLLQMLGDQTSSR